MKDCLHIKKEQCDFGQKGKRESGMMVVEALISFTIFVMVIAAIVYLITIFTLHNRIQFAINSTAHELASYSYVYQALGVRSAGKTMEGDGAKYTGAIDDTAEQLVDTWNQIENLQGSASGVQSSIENLSPSEIQNAVKNFSQDAKDTVDSAKESVTKVKSLLSNPNDLLVGIIYMAADAAAIEAKSAFATFAAEGITEKYLAVGETSADDYLKSMGVAEGYEGLDFSGSTMFCDPDRRLIDIVVEYDIDLKLIQLLVPEAKLHMTQRVTVAGWLGGDDRTLDKYGVKKQ